MKRYDFSKILAPLGRSFMALTILAGMSACDNVIYDYGEDCDPEQEFPSPAPEPDLVRISVRSNPGGGGTSAVHDVADPSNSAETTEGIYVSIDVEEDGTYTLTATESNPGYVFVRWHDDTNDGDLTEGLKVIANIKAETSAKYTAIFRKIEEPEEPEPGNIRISVRSNPGGGGTSAVHDASDPSNSAETTEGIYVNIDVEEDGTYTLTATESNPEYVFVRWHDDTNDGDLTEGLMVIPHIKAEESAKYTAIFRKIEEPEKPQEPVPGSIKIFVRSNPGGGGTSAVHEVGNTTNRVETTEGIYVSIKVEENGTYTLTATESNPEYEFVRWHDDTNDGNLTEGLMVIPNLTAETTTKYTAIFKKKQEPEEPSGPTEPDLVKIYVRSNPGSGGTSRVHEVGNAANSAETSEGIYVSIQIEENGTYTLTATESNPEYEFVRWHDDTNNGDLTEGVKVIPNLTAEAPTRYTAIFKKKPEPEEPSGPTEPSEPEPVRIYVRSNPGGGGTARVHEAGKAANSAETSESAYVGIEVQKNGTYTLTAAETSDDYEFVRWHDDTNNGDLTEGVKVIPNLVASASTRYTAVFQKKQEPDQPSEPTEPEPESVRIYVRVNPGSGGTAMVFEDDDASNSKQTSEGIYVSIDIKKGSAYTLSATESNEEYEFVRWHDDTNNGDLTEGLTDIPNLTAEVTTRYTAVFKKIEKPAEPTEPEPEIVKIYVRSNPGSGGSSKVHEVGNPSNSAETTEGIYVSIDIKKGSAYTLSATESNKEYEFVRWHDDTNNGDLTEGLTDISNLTAEVTTRYTAVFRKIEKPAEPTEPEPEIVKIYVRSNPGSGGSSKVHEVGNPSNRAETTEGAYVGIEVEKNGTYTLTAAETSDDYEFVRWHDDTNNGDLTEGLMVIPNLTAEMTTRYTAVFNKKQQPDQPDIPTPDDEPEGYYVKFVFDRNMQFTDGFSQRVTSVDLYVFNPSGTFITKYHEEGAVLKNTGYLMELTDLPAGTYELIAWCGLANNGGHFTVPVSVSRNYETICTMPTKSDAAHKAYQNENLTALFHGRETKATYVAKTREKQIQTVYLTKNTNNVNITLQHRQGLPFNKERFAVTMHDKNDVMKHDNEMFEGVVQEVQYRPYRTVYGSTSNAEAETTGNFLQVELSTARLMTTNNPIIEVVDTENNNKVIFSIPLVKWALQLRSAQYKSMDSQEYLDREDNYNLMLWMDSNRNDGWFGAEININDWHVIDDTQDIK